jgi:hypothetical protein
MFRPGRPALLALFAANVSLAACAPDPAEKTETKTEEAVGVHFLLIPDGATKGTGGCALLVADGTNLAGFGSPAPIPADSYREEITMRDGKASLRYFIRPEPKQETAHPDGVLALEIELQLGSFHPGDARLEHFATRDGTEHATYVWGEADCGGDDNALPAWVSQQLMPRRP